MQDRTHRWRRDWWLGLIIIGLASAVIFYHLGVGSIWRDEAFSVELSKRSIPLINHVMFTIEGNMYVYYMILHLWLGWLSHSHLRWSAFWVRVPSAVFYVLSAAALFILGRTIWRSAWAGFVAALIFLSIPFAITYGQQARSFSMFYMATAVSYWALWKAWHGSKRWWAIYAGLTAFSLYVFLTSTLFILAQVLWALGIGAIHRDERRKIIMMGMALVGAAILSLPLVPPILAGGQIGWVPIPHLIDLVHLLPTYLEKPVVSPLMAVNGLIGLVGLVLMAIGGSGRDSTSRPAADLTRRALGMTLLWTVIPPISAFVVAHIKYHLYDPVYLLPVVMGWALFLTGTMFNIPQRSLRWAALGLLALVSFTQIGKGQGVSLENWRQPVAAWAHAYRPGQRVVCFNNIDGCQYTLQYFIDSHHYPIKILPYPGYFSWGTYIQLANKGKIFSQAVNVSALRQSGVLQPGHEVWFAWNGATPQQKAPLMNWLNHHASLQRTVQRHGWPVVFQLFRIGS